MSAEPRILVIDDEPQILRALRTILTEKKFQVATAGRGEEGLALAAADPPDLVILDLGLPDMNGIQVCARLREWTQVPIIVLSVRDSERDKVAALDRGADDYLTKPFGIQELLARIRVALRRSASGPESGVVTSKELSFDFGKRMITVRGKPVHLTPKEFDLLREMVAHHDTPISHRRLLQAVWGPDYGDETEYLRVVINQLRKKIEVNPAKPKYILTEPWVGYRLVLPADSRIEEPATGAAPNS
jgi:two-component system KDP operon response regulator KdpE